ncbi:hypothetical protein ACHAWO_007349 [Cyclotella atomus]|uniref:Uncharacterized protein n=1 Tax=Cyclotella atomus TaxID=382360 RepID=A0ABD3PCD2_9STRA
MKSATASTAANLTENELGVKIITDENQLQSYNTIESASYQELLSYTLPLILQDWKNSRDHHVYILQWL